MTAILTDLMDARLIWNEKMGLNVFQKQITKLMITKQILTVLFLMMEIEVLNQSTLLLQ